MGLVILSVFALVFAACGDSSTGSTSGPPAITDNGNGPDTTTPTVPTTPGTTTPTKTVINIKYEGTIGTYSSEGQKPEIGDIAPVTVYYSDNTIEKIDKAEDVQAKLGTIPALINRQNVQFGSGTGTQIVYVYRDGYPATEAGIISVEIPGARQFEGVATGGSFAKVGSTEFTVSNLGAKPAITVSGKVTESYFEDEEAPLDMLSGLIVKARYKATTANNPTPSDGNKGTATPTGEYEDLVLTKDHIYTYYQHTFTQAEAGFTGAGTKQDYPFGIDPWDMKVHILLSRDPTDDAKSIVLTAPFKGYHYVRGFELAAPLEWSIKATDATTEVETPYPFLFQVEVLGNNQDAWNQALIAAKIKPRVYYLAWDGYKDRDTYYFERGVQLGRAGVSNAVNVRNSDDDDFGDMVIGYYSSYPRTWRDPISRGDFPNIIEEKAPIAVWVDDEGLQFAKKPTNKDRDNLSFIFDTDAFPASKEMSYAQLRAIQESYNLVAKFRYEQTTVENYLVMPGKHFRLGMFSSELKTRVTEREDVTLTFRMPSNFLQTAAPNTGKVWPYKELSNSVTTPDGFPFYFWEKTIIGTGEEVGANDGPWGFSDETDKLASLTDSEHQTAATKYNFFASAEAELDVWLYPDPNDVITVE